MSKKTFNPAEWLSKPNAEQIAFNSAEAQPTFAARQWISDKPKQIPQSQESLQSLNTNNDLEEITRRIESASIDIAPNYADWRDLGFALADALGESGRNYYHRLSRFYPSYSQSETDKQYSACLASHGHGVTIKTLYHLAKSAGISVSIQQSSSPSLGGVGEVKSPKVVQGERRGKSSFDYTEPQPTFDLSIPQNGEMEEMGNQEKQLPAFPKEIFETLPGLLHAITSNADSPEDADLLLLGSLTVFSACMPNVYGVYGQHEVFPNLFLFVTAKASAGKGRLSLCRRLVEPIHQMMRQQCKAEQEEYKLKLTQYNASSDKAHEEKPEEPPLRTLIIPANNSATGLFQLLKENNEKGLIFETEGDTLAQTFKSESSRLPHQ